MQNTLTRAIITLTLRLLPMLWRELFMKNITSATTSSDKKLQWHQAFYANIQIEFKDFADKLIFENEHHLGTQPKRIDVLIIKKEDSTPITKNIGRIFRKHNILEYKSPDDYISINDYYLVYGYACLYKSDESRENHIPINEITITLVSRNFPKKLAKYLKKVLKYDIQFIENGIYYINGDIIPIQLIVTKDLTDEQNVWLHNLTNDIHNTDVVNMLILEYDKHQKDNHYKSVMDILVHANKETFKEVTNVCKALEDLYWEVHGERIQREQKEALDKAVSEAVSKAVTEAISEKDLLLAEKDSILASQAAYIKQLEAQLGITTA